MGTPACRISDETAHGGVVVMGFPTVLIGMMPASRIGDNHVCPMVTPGVPPVPHVGGPFVMGSPTVLVGEMPQSRVTDQLVCVGPPDVAVMGEPTVLVGMAGAGGMAGALGGLAAMGASVPMQAPPPPQFQASLKADGTIETSAPPGGSLPPVPLMQAGWPDLPAQATGRFQRVRPVTLAPGTTLYEAAGCWWRERADALREAAESGVGVRRITLRKGVRAWMGAVPDGRPLVWMPAGAPRAREKKARGSNGRPVDRSPHKRSVRGSRLS
jgi:uncharacterized Zn-binding protein involved in type VI secretion